MDVTGIPFAFPGLADRVGCFFQTREGGASMDPFDAGNISFTVGDDPAAVRANRMALQKRLGFTHWVEAKQVHGVDILLDPPPGDIEADGEAEADGLTTAEPGRALVIKTADCQPVLIAHRGGAFVAALHVGWRGNAQELPLSAVAALCDHYGVSPDSLAAVRGPSLGPSASEFTNFDAEFGPAFEPYVDRNTMRVNLWKLTHDQLVTAGVPADNIYAIDLCTFSLPRTFFSYRAARTSGRHANLIWLS
ncbi:polyphenol oxidase family protein [Oceanidesulfovibrio marinus]|uniref:Laccase domain-containing protein n=1 Tax=Oceanidesulfovibrio marinus TaxID=370038 RepID=A0ABX6NID2_9BACT|nr:polyphenol oxidase family protein [Oceanidesulfovibrio marinus]QJT10413.1 laccase domain-containing protein [Oceanidesulfovibrio marinus]